LLGLVQWLEKRGRHEGVRPQEGNGPVRPAIEPAVSPDEPTGPAAAV